MAFIILFAIVYTGLGQIFLW